MLVAVLSVPFYVVGALSPTVRVGAVDMPASAAMFVVPLVAAVVLVWRDAGRAGVVALLAGVVDRPAGRARWYAVAVALPVVVGAGVVLAGAVPVGLATSLVVLPLVFGASVVAAAFEEVGWTGYAADPLRRRFGVVGAGVVLGVFWGVWHLLPLVQAGHGAVWIGGWFVGTVAARVVMVGLRAVTGGVSAAVLMHAMLNVTAAYVPGYDAAVVPVVSGVLTVVAAVVVVWVVSRSRSRAGVGGGGGG
ncbi:CPBP family intramembrane glutamic endopeptidase [Nonomuraea sp. NPDC049725]|uniref:CPBP family intramembrane glutamic endopeptidase n=1 Tax=Nonomuraea sp. NPDC049725 TaxID=3154508 RepID=UPI003416C00F